MLIAVIDPKDKVRILEADLQSLPAKIQYQLQHTSAIEVIVPYAGKYFVCRASGGYYEKEELPLGDTRELFIPERKNR